MNLWLTPEETILAITSLDPPRHVPTYRQLRYWDDEGVVPASRVHERGARLYGPADVAMLRLAMRVLNDGRTLRQVSEALRYRSAEVREAFRLDRVLVLTFGPRGIAAVVPASSVAAGNDAYELRACYRGVIDAMRAQRREEPAVWTGWRYERPSVLEIAAIT